MWNKLCTPQPCLGWIALALMVVTSCAPSGPGQEGPNDSETEGPANGTQDDGSDQLPSGKFGLWTQGVQLRGANIYQRRVYPELDGTDFLGPEPLGPPYSLGDFERLAVLGANYVNISHTGLFSERPPYRVDVDAQKNLDTLLARIASADMFAVISFRSGPGRGEFALFPGQDWYPAELVNDEVWQDRDAQDAWVAMWSYVAERYRTNPIVVGYDLMVEPNSADVVLGVYSPEEFYPAQAGTLLDWNQLFPRIVEGVRQVDAETPILVGAAGYSSVAWLDSLLIAEDDRVVYTIHQYEPFSFTHQGREENLTYPGTLDADGDGRSEQVDRAWLETVYEMTSEFSSKHGVPVAVNEFGAHRYAPGAARYLSDEFDVLERLGWNHAIWLWNSSHPPQSEVDDFDYSHGTDSANHGVVESELLEAIRTNWQQNQIRPSNFAP